LNKESILLTKKEVEYLLTLVYLDTSRVIKENNSVSVKRHGEILDKLEEASFKMIGDNY
jgi:hypothetical protein